MSYELYEVRNECNSKMKGKILE